MNVQPSKVIAAGKVTGATGAVTAPAANFMRTFTVVRNGAGDYSITLAASFQCDATERCVKLTARTANRTLRYVDTSDTVIQVLANTVDAVAMIVAADCDFDFEIARIGAGA